VHGRVQGEGGGAREAVCADVPSVVHLTANVLCIINAMANTITMDSEAATMDADLATVTMNK
jgi:hypothetical protein